MVCGKSNLKKKQRFDEEPKRAKMPYFMQTSKAWKSNLEYNPRNTGFKPKFKYKTYETKSKDLQDYIGKL